MGIEYYLKELLYRYNCIIIPGLGAFLTQKKSAVLQKASNTFYPPTKIVSFNGLLTNNDGLLVSYMAEAEKVGYEVMLQRTTQATSEWKTRLQRGERLSFPAIGELWQNQEGKIQFQPLEQVNFLTSSYGFSSFVSAPITREVLKKEVEILEEKAPIIITPEQRNKSSFRPYLKYAAIFLLALSTSVTAYRTYEIGIDNQRLAQEEAEEQVSRQIQEATFFDASPLELPTLTLNADTKERRPIATTQKTHYIIAGAFRFKKNAEKKIRQLKRQGFNSAYLGTNDFGLHMVSYDSFTNPELALQTLREIKRTQSSDAWLKSVK